jgi:hypothetical protein
MLSTALAGAVYHIEAQRLHHSTPKKICVKYYCDISLESSAFQKYSWLSNGGWPRHPAVTPRPSEVCAIWHGRFGCYTAPFKDYFL